jgi:hypothetical protein
MEMRIAPTAPQPSAGAGLTAPRVGLADLGRAGCSPAEVAALVARAEGLPAVPGGWTMREIQSLLFVRWLARAQRLDG